MEGLARVPRFIQVGDGSRAAPGSPGDLVGSAWRLWELDLCWAPSSSFCPRQRSLVLSSLDTVIVWHRVMGGERCPGAWMPCKGPPGRTPKLIMYLAVGRDP